MALLRATDIPTRIHGFTVDKKLFRGVLNGIWYKLAPNEILHSWTEVYVHGKWYYLEGVILDKSYLEKLQERNKECKTAFCGFGADTDNLIDPPIDWNLNNTYIQHKGIVQDFGLFDTPDEFYKKHQQKVGFFKRFMFRNVVRHRMTKNVKKIRNGR